MRVSLSQFDRKSPSWRTDRTLPPTGNVAQQSPSSGPTILAWQQQAGPSGSGNDIPLSSKETYTLMKLIVKRRKISDISPTATKVELSAEYFISEIRKQVSELQTVIHGTVPIGNEDVIAKANNINRLYIVLFYRFPINTKHFEDFLNFHLNFKAFITENSQLLSIMSHKHAIPEVFITLCKFIYTTQSNIAKIRQYFELGIKRHEQSQSLYVEYFGIEIDEMVKSNDKSFKFVLKKYNEFIQIFKYDLSFHFKLLDKAINNENKKLQIHILKDTVSIYSSNELMWQKLASLNYDGHIFDRVAGKIEYDENYLRRIIHSFQAYEDGLHLNPSPASQCIIWRHYAQHILNIWSSISIMTKDVLVLLTEHMKRAFQRAHERKVLPNEYYIYWAEFSTNDCEKVILDRAIKMNRNNANIIDVWTTIIKNFLKHKLYQTANRVLKDSLGALEGKSLPLWKMMISFYDELDDKSWIADLYAIAVVCRYTIISTEFRVQYLNWSQKHMGKTFSRKLFQALKLLEPAQSDIYFSMIFHEKSDDRSVNFTFINKLYIEVCDKFSPSNNALWFEGIKFNYENNRILEIQQMFEAAASVLTPDLVADLKTKFGYYMATARDNQVADNEYTTFS